MSHASATFLIVRKSVKMPAVFQVSGRRTQPPANPTADFNDYLLPFILLHPCILIKWIVLLGGFLVFSAILT